MKYLYSLLFLFPFSLGLAAQSNATEALAVVNGIMAIDYRDVHAPLVVSPDKNTNAEGQLELVLPENSWAGSQIVYQVADQLPYVKGKDRFIFSAMLDPGGRIKEIQTTKALMELSYTGSSPVPTGGSYGSRKFASFKVEDGRLMEATSKWRSSKKQGISFATFRFEYDEAGRLSKMTEYRQPGKGKPGNYQAKGAPTVRVEKTFGYVADSKEVTLREVIYDRNKAGKVLSDNMHRTTIEGNTYTKIVEGKKGYVSSYASTYDDDLRILNRTSMRDGKVSSTETYTYNAEGQIESNENLVYRDGVLYTKVVVAYGPVVKKDADPSTAVWGIQLSTTYDTEGVAIREAKGYEYRKREMDGTWGEWGYYDCVVR